LIGAPAAAARRFHLLAARIVRRAQALVISSFHNRVNATLTINLAARTGSAAFIVCRLPARKQERWV
jgi:molybdopterin biosynthesis enzyme